MPCKQNESNPLINIDLNEVIKPSGGPALIADAPEESA